FGVLSQFTDEDGHPGLGRHIEVPGVYAAGRLDHDSEGLLVLTSDNRLKARLTEPRHGHAKVYWAQVEGTPDESALRQLREGVLVQGTRTRPAGAALLEPPPELPPRVPPIRERRHIPTTWLVLTLREGRNRQVRRMTAAVGHPTLRLVRVAVGPLRLEGLPPGAWRELGPDEVARLWLALGGR
ncbi:MAG: pseudouridine synthase, partial [Candidatus Sericytochromatia bacterium]|nr:pseudouridine synthase [Candidatus Sericytochromatia bacterium]